MTNDAGDERPQHIFSFLFYSALRNEQTGTYKEDFMASNTSKVNVPQGPRRDTSQQQDGDRGPQGVSRRSFLLNMGLLAAATALVQGAGVLSGRGWLAPAQAATTDVVHDTVNGLLAFIVPGPDEYSIAQGVSTLEPGGVDANVTDIFIATLDQSTPFLPNFSATVAAILNDLALSVNPSASGAFLSAFARLSFGEKVAVFQIMDGTDPLKPLAGLLPAFAAFLSYSEAGVFDPQTRSLTGQPVGWTISAYQGVSNGRDEFRGYFENRRSVR